MVIFTKNGRQLLYEKESYILRGLWMKIYNQLGPGHKEITYQNAFEKLLKRLRIPYIRESVLCLIFEGEKVGTYRPDFVVYGKIIVEFKSVEFIPQVFIKKIYQYLKTSNYRLAFIVNFGATKLEVIRRIFDSKRDLNNPQKSACNPHNPRRGFTLIETLIYIAIIGGVVGSFVAFALSINNSRSKTYVVQEVQANARVALELVAQKIRLADDVISPTEGNTSDTLVLDMPGPDPDLILSVTDGALGIAEGVGDPTPITSDEVNVSSLNFTNLAGSGERDNISIAITVEYNNSSGGVEFDYAQDLRTAVSLRK